MAVLTVRTDDLTGDPDATPTTITVNGKGVTLDLAQKSADKLAAALAPFFTAGVEADYDVARRGRPRNGTGRGYDLAQLRQWAADNAIALPQRGRIPAEIVQRYLHR
jgi:hypothetical protein